MKVSGINLKESQGTLPVIDSFVGKGLVEGGHSALPDIDVDYASDRRQEIKEYLEQRYNINGKQHVFSAGTFSSMKLKAVIKDVARVYRVPLNIVNYITAIFNDEQDWTDLFLLAAVNKKVNKFVHDYPEVIEDIRTIMGQPRSTSIHASAIIVTPETKDGEPAECFDFLPIRKMDELLVSEFDGYAVDEIGLLKEDVLATKELSKLSAVINIVNRVYEKNYSIESITQNEIEDSRTYKLLAEGYTQNVFQFASKGITRFITDVRPDCIEDLIAINALYRPATLEIKATDDYIKYKHGEVAPVYSFGTYEATKNTYGIMCIAEDTRIATRKGCKSIQNIVPGDFVLTEDGTFQQVTRTYKKGIKKTVLIKTSMGRKLYCTDDHRVLTQLGWVQAGKLIPGKHRIKTFYTQDDKIDEEYRQYPIWCPVLSVTTSSEKMTYDLSVWKRHSFCANNMIVHNCYQEQFMSIAHSLGGFDLGKTDYLRKAIGKKKADLMATLKEDFIKGAVNNGCPDYEAEEIWHKIEVAGKYSFNRSHAAAYALTAFAGAWLKANYPSAFYTIALQWADDKEVVLLMSEMEQCSQAKIVPPDINVSIKHFFTDYKTDEIFWSLTKIKMLGDKAVEYLLEEREKNGRFTSIENFIHRIFKYKLKKYEYWDDPDEEQETVRVPVNARHVKNLVLSGCFDKLENVKAVTERYSILVRAAKELGFQLSEEDFPKSLTDKHYYWSMQQIAVSGVGRIDYHRIYDNSEAKNKLKGKVCYMSLCDASILENEGKRIVVCVTVSEMSEASYKDKVTGEKKKFCKLKLQQNNDMIELVMWNDYYTEHKKEITDLTNKVIIISAVIRYSDYNGANNLQTYKTSTLMSI